MDPKEKIYYCSMCAITKPPKPLGIPLGGGELAAGYCRLCGTNAPYIGYMTREELENLGVEIPTLQELSEMNAGIR